MYLRRNAEHHFAGYCLQGFAACGCAICDRMINSGLEIGPQFFNLNLFYFPTFSDNFSPLFSRPTRYPSIIK